MIYISVFDDGYEKNSAVGIVLFYSENELRTVLLKLYLKFSLL